MARLFSGFGAQKAAVDGADNANFKGAALENGCRQLNTSINRYVARLLQSYLVFKYLRYLKVLGYFTVSRDWPHFADPRARITV